jgi:branched-chain amino acid transport system permease protein
VAEKITTVAGARSFWRRLPLRSRRIFAVAIQLLLAVIFLLWEPSVGWAIVVLGALLWAPKLPLYYRLGLEAAVVVGSLIFLPALGIMLAVLIAVLWIPESYRLGRIAVRQTALVLVAVLAAVLYPYYVDKLFDIPVFGPFPDVSTGVVMMIFIMMAVGLNIVVGYAGLLDLGYVAFYAIGAYTVAWFASLQFSNRNVHIGAVGIDPSLPGFHISIWLLLLLAGFITAAGGMIIGLPTLRLRGDYLAIVTLGFGEILPQVARNGDNFFGTGFNLTNGPNGITPIDAPGWGTRLSDWTGGFLPENYLVNTHPDRVYYWTAIVLLLITVFCSWRLRDSRLGRAWIAIREDEVAAAAMGVPLMRTKTWAYATGAFFGGVAGAYYASFRSATFPGDFFFNISVFILCMVILGGMGSIWGVVVGAGFLAYLNQAGLANTGAWINDHFNTNIDVPKYQFGIYGVIILVVMLFRPEGLIPDRRRQVELHEGGEGEYLYDVEQA